MFYPVLFCVSVKNIRTCLPQTSGGGAPSASRSTKVDGMLFSNKVCMYEVLFHFVFLLYHGDLALVMPCIRLMFAYDFGALFRVYSIGIV